MSPAHTHPAGRCLLAESHEAAAARYLSATEQLRAIRFINCDSPSPCTLRYHAAWRKVRSMVANVMPLFL